MGEMVKLQEWISRQGLRVVVLFEGRDEAAKGDLMGAIAGPLNPRMCSVTALGVPSDRERTQWYFQRFVAHLPAAGEMVLLGHSWYAHAGEEHVKGLCSDTEYHDFLRPCPEFERMLAPWFVVPADDERRARLNVLAHLLAHIPYEDLPLPHSVALPPLQQDFHVRPPVSDQTHVPQLF
ncbi:unnamed protein product [Closterium sp. Naga37s-1]|nr:unnamed protein product [Closterium sp. Naga37s-1]